MLLRFPVLRPALLLEPESGSVGPCGLPGGRGGCRTVGLVQGAR